MCMTAQFWAICCMERKPASGATRLIAASAIVIREHAPRAKDFTNRRYRHRGMVDEAQKARNRTKSRVRAKVEHCFAVIKGVFGFTKLRYRGLEKNAQRLFVACSLANLFMIRRRLMPA